MPWPERVKSHKGQEIGRNRSCGIHSHVMRFASRDGEVHTAVLDASGLACGAHIAAPQKNNHGCGIHNVTLRITGWAWEIPRCRCANCRTPPWISHCRCANHRRHLWTSQARPRSFGTALLASQARPRSFGTALLASQARPRSFGTALLEPPGSSAEFLERRCGARRPVELQTTPRMRVFEHPFQTMVEGDPTLAQGGQHQLDTIPPIPAWRACCEYGCEPSLPRPRDAR